LVHLSSQSGGVFPDLPVIDLSDDLYCDWELQVMAAVSESLGARMRAQDQWASGTSVAPNAELSALLCY
jgi:hypothetical protein